MQSSDAGLLNRTMANIPALSGARMQQILKGTSGEPN